jgi:hypothetical protein
MHLGLSHGKSIQCSKLGDVQVHRGARVILLGDLARPLLLNISEREFEKLKLVVQFAKEFLWVTTGASYDSQSPERAMSLGFTRSLRAEFPTLSIATLDFSPRENESVITDCIWRHIGGLPSPDEDEPEQAIFDGVTYIERVVPDEDYQEGRLTEDMSMTLFHQKNALKLDVETVGLFDSLFFKDDKDHDRALGSSEVEVKVNAVGMNMKVILKSRLSW